MKATNIIVSVLGDVLPNLWGDQTDNPFSMIKVSDAQFASTRTSSLFAVLSLFIAKRQNGKEDMAQYMDKAHQLFARLVRIGSNAISKKFRVPSFLFSIGHNSPFKSKLFAFWTNRIKNLSWKDLSSGTIAEQKSVCAEKGSCHPLDNKPKADNLAGAV